MNLIRRPSRKEANAVIAHKVRLIQSIGSQTYPSSDDEIYERVTLARSRNEDDSEGTLRQTAAVLATGCRRNLLKQISVKTLVIHGDEDPLIPLAAGIDTAKCIPGARMEIITGMGHDFPKPLIARTAKVILGHISNIELSRTSQQSGKFTEIP